MSSSRPPPAETQDDATLARTLVDFTLTIGPIQNVACDLSGIVGPFVEELFSAFQAPLVARRVNAALTELVDNVLENSDERGSPVTLRVRAGDGRVVVQVRNIASQDQYERVAAHVARVRDAPDLKALMRDTLRARRARRLEGGLGLLRLSAENHFDVAVERQHGWLTVTATLDLGASP